MTKRTITPHGLWKSPLSPASLAEGKRLDGVAWDSDSDTLVWLEGRSGRGVLVAQRGDQAPRDLTAELSVRAEIGYGGGDFAVHAGHVYFVVHKTGRLFRQALEGGAAKPITPAFGKVAAPVVSPDGRFVVYVHQDDDQNDRLGIVDTQGRMWPQIIASGHDFYMQPRFSPDGNWLCFIAWDHPQMPWDGTKLYLARVRTGEGELPCVEEPRLLAGDRETAIFQPEFTCDSRRLVYVSDETGWGRLVVQDLETFERRLLTPDGEEYGSPAWVQGVRTYAVLADGRHLAAAGSRLGFQRLVEIELETGHIEPVQAMTEYSEVGMIAAAPLGRRFALVASGSKQPPRVVVCDLESSIARVVARSSGETVRAAALADCEAITWTTAGGEKAHGLYYPPASEHRHEGADVSGLAPLVTIIHGGPTSQVKAGWNATTQFFATRGYAVLQVNYRGSTGYGRDYMLRLRRNWGVCDVEDAVSGKQHLLNRGLIDPSRTVIMGGSAGGFTVLQTLIDHPHSFTAGINMFGVASQFGLAADTHKFESRYLDSMLGPLPEASDIYRQRSPVFHAAKIERPLAVFQGGIDTVVPRDQSEAIVAALKRNGTPHIYHVYEDEGHGWRKRETIEHFYSAIDKFLRDHVIFA